MATATATAASQLERDKQHLEASYGKQIHAAPHPTYVSAAWARDHPDKYGATAATGYQTNVPTGIETILNIMDAEIRGEQTWRFVADENAPEYVKKVAEALNAAGSTWDHAVDGPWLLANTAFNAANWATATNAADAELIKAMMALFEEATALGMSPVKASMAVMLVNMYPGMRIEFGYATPKAANNIIRFNRVGNGDRLDQDPYERNAAGTGTPEGTNAPGNNPYTIGDLGEGGATDYAAEVEAAQNAR